VRSRNGLRTLGRQQSAEGLRIVFVKLTVHPSIYHRLNSKLYDILTELGVELVEDLDTIFQGDESLLLTIRAQLAAPDVDAFIRTYHAYKELVEDNSSVKSTSEDESLLGTSVCEKFKSGISLGGHVSATDNRTAQKEANIARRIEGNPTILDHINNCSL